MDILRYMGERFIILVRKISTVPVDIFVYIIINYNIDRVSYSCYNEIK